MMEKEWEKLRFEMVERQLKRRGISDEHILDTFLKVPRHLFVEKEFLAEAYYDYPLGIGYGQTISQPYMVALMTQKLHLDKEDCVLEIGTGSGYQTAILADLVASVYTIERILPLLNKAKDRLTKLGYNNIYYACKDGNDGWDEDIQFDAILIAAATNSIPKQLFQQLKIGGKMILPLGSNLFQRLTLIEKKEKRYEIKPLCGCRFVPLISRGFTNEE